MIPHSLKLFSESDLLPTIREYSKELNIYGYISGVVGNLRKVTIECPNNNSVNVFEGSLEIISLNGFFDKGEAHIHLSFSDEKCSVFGGHLEDGCIVKKGVDLFLLSFEKNIQSINSQTFYVLNKRVKIYVLNNCPWSKRAIRLLKASNINYDVQIIDSDELFKKLNQKSNHNTFPQIFVDDNFFGGFDELSNLYKKDSLKSFK